MREVRNINPIHGLQSKWLYVKKPSVLEVSKMSDLGLTNYGVWSQANVFGGVFFYSSFGLILGVKAEPSHPDSDSICSGATAFQSAFKG